MSRSRTSSSGSERSLAQLDKTRIAIALLDLMNKSDLDATKPLKSGKKRLADDRLDVIIDANLMYRCGLTKARAGIIALLADVPDVSAIRDDPRNSGAAGSQYVFAKLTTEQIRTLIAKDEHELPADRVIYKIWLDHDVQALINSSRATIKADAAFTAFGTSGAGVVWAVLDSGVEADHPHFEMHRNLDLQHLRPIHHRDFTAATQSDDKEEAACTDPLGHGTHVAGIIAGELIAGQPYPANASGAPGDTQAAIRAVVFERDSNDNGRAVCLPNPPGRMTGMAPQAKIVSLKVLDDKGAGKASTLIAALMYINEVNSYGRHLLIHGVNISAGYPFKPEWFACGESPLCVEVNRLVASGVVVVVAAGNTGHAISTGVNGRTSTAGQQVTINDPGNADLAITVGATHRNMPHRYGVSYFSSKGPTGDGRLKPDLVAPGEKILSCASKGKASKYQVDSPGEAGCGVYIDDSGTSMAAPHVSGAIAAFLSVRDEFKGRPHDVKRIFVDQATCLGRERYFQGAGLVDLMRAIQSV